MGKKTILLLYAAPDSGHAQVAHALAQALEAEGHWRPVEDNVVSYFPTAGPLFLKLYKWMIFNWSGLWGHLHDNPDYARAVKGSESWIYKMDFFRVHKILEKHKPDAVLATHALPLRCLAVLKAKGQFDLPLYALTTDFWAHRYWAHKSVDHYFASTLQARRDLTRNGVAGNRISVTGIPLREEFSVPLESLESGRIRKTILVLGGSYGVLPYSDLVQTALDDEDLKKCSWFFVFGNNRKDLDLAKKIVSLKDRRRVKLFGFTSEVASLMAVSDLMIGKAGALSASEALVKGLPQVIARPMPGQETKNADFLVKSGAAVRADQMDRLIHQVKSLVNNDQKLGVMKRAARRLAKPDAAQRVVKLLNTFEQC